MFLKKSRYKNGRTYLSICQSYRQDGKNKTKTCKKIGYLDQFTGLYADPIAHFEKMTADMDAAYKAEHASIDISFSPDKKIDMRACNRRNAGYAVLSTYYHRLGIRDFWRNRADKRGFDYDANAIFRMLVWSRLLYPASKKADFEGRGRWFDKCDFTLDDVYRSLSFFDSYKEDLVAAMNKAVAAMRKRKTDNVYYDVTNYYFEIDSDDELRRRGVSKEHRPNPIVQMGLLIDGDGIPITYRTYPGNTNDCLTLMPVLKDVRKRYDLGRIVVVADKGLNTSDNIAANILAGNGYVFSQSVRKATRELQDWVLDQADYTGDGGSFKIKSRQSDKIVYVEGPDGKKRQVAVPVKQVAFWSADYEKRARCERAAVLEKSLKLAASDASWEHAKSYGAARYVKETTIDADTGEIRKTLIEFDEEAIASDERFDGYYCIITSETDKGDEEIIEIYRGLWRIEESFKVTKSDLAARPIYVSREDHIEAHFLICYAALVILRLIQVDTGYRYSAKTICGELSKLECSHLKERYWHFDYRSEITDELCARVGINLSREILGLKEIQNILSETRVR